MDDSLKPSKIAQIPEYLDWTLSVIEPLTVLLIASIVAYATYRLVFSSNDVQRARMIETMKAVGEHWKAVLLVLVVLFYRTVRVFLEQTEQAFGMTRKKPLPGEPEKAPNPQQAGKS